MRTKKIKTSELIKLITRARDKAVEREELFKNAGDNPYHVEAAIRANGYHVALTDVLYALNGNPVILSIMAS